MEQTKKLKIREAIFTKHYPGLIYGFPFSDLPKDILPTDLIDLEKERGYVSENNSYDDGGSTLVVYRERLENDAEFLERKAKSKFKSDELRENRLRLYEKLKKEFE